MHAVAPWAVASCTAVCMQATVSERGGCLMLNFALLLLPLAPAAVVYAAGNGHGTHVGGECPSIMYGSCLLVT